MARFLVVEDDQAQRLLMKIILEREGHQFVSADHGAAALDILAEDSTFDAVVTDLHMPYMSGNSLVREIRGRYPTLPVIVMSVRTGIEWQEEARRNGATMCLAKPFLPKQLTETIEQIVSQPEQA